MEKSRVKGQSHMLILLGLVSILAACLFIAGCAVENSALRVKDGKVYGRIDGAFRDKWWNFYERGLSYADGGFHAEAMADFENAVAQRDADTRMARTYGMHFIDYFPHRELGILFFKTGDLYRAREELNVSIAAYPSAKARYYLDKTRKSILEKENPQATVPKIRIRPDQDKFQTASYPFILTGTAQDDNFVSLLTIDGKPVFMEGASQKVDFSRPLFLSQGLHQIAVNAENLSGKQSTRTIEIEVDREGPVISLRQIMPVPDVNGRTLEIKGSIYDPSGVKELVINDRRIVPGPMPETDFEISVVKNGHPIAFSAEDRLGNQTRMELPAAFGSPSPGSRAAGSALVACDGCESVPGFYAELFMHRDTRPPMIEIKHSLSGETVFQESVFIEGIVSDDDAINGLTVNNRSMLRRPGKVVFVNHLFHLKEGENRITISAVDKSGNQADKSIYIIRKVPEVLKLNRRMRLSISSFEERGDKNGLHDRFEDGFVNAMVAQDRFRVLERDRLNAILAEQKLSRTDLVDKETAVRIGRLLSAQYIVAGSIIANTDGVEIVSRLIDTETSEIMSTQDVYDETVDTAGLRNLAEGLAVKYHHAFPLVKGSILKQKTNELFVKMDADAVKPMQRLIVYREVVEKDEQTGAVLFTDVKVLGRVQVNRILPEVYCARIIGDQAFSATPADRVITE